MENKKKIKDCASNWSEVSKLMHANYIMAKSPKNLNHEMVVTRMATPKYGETLKFMYAKYQPILVV